MNYSKDDDLEKQGQLIKDELYSLSERIFNTAPETDHMAEYYLYCIQQATHQIEHVINKNTISFKEQLQLIKEWSINIANFSLAMTSVVDKIDKDVKTDGSRFSTGYGTWATPNNVIRKALNEACSLHFDRLKKKMTVIDSLKLTYLDIVLIQNPETKESILNDNKILDSVKLFFKHQYFLHFIYNWQYFFNECEMYFQEVKDTLNKPS